MRTALALVAAAALGVAAKKFAVEVDPRELAILGATLDEVTGAISQGL